MSGGLHTGAIYQTGHITHRVLQSTPGTPVLSRREILWSLLPLEVMGVHNNNGGEQSVPYDSQGAGCTAAQSGQAFAPDQQHVSRGA